MKKKNQQTFPEMKGIDLQVKSALCGGTAVQQVKSLLVTLSAMDSQQSASLSRNSSAVTV